MFKSLQEKLGPGLMFAASAVGVSHLVQSTRGGAAFGFGILLIIFGICLLKYPLFLFSAHYTAVTGDTIIDGYKKLGRWILYVIFAVYIFELPFAIAGISVISAGVLIESLGLQLNEIVAALCLVSTCLVLSAVGRYRLLELVSTVFVVIFIVCIAVGSLIPIVSNPNDYSLALVSIQPTAENLFFLVALAGWMPVGVGGVLGISMWIHAKNKRLGRNLTPGEVRFDFNCSYAIVIITACCFALLGAYTLYSDNFDLGGESVAFAGQLLDIFTRSFAPWTHWIIVIGANAVLLSSLLIVADLLPRLGTTLLQRLYPDRFTQHNQFRLYLAFMLYEILSVILVLVLLYSSYTTFIDLVISLGFLAAPILAFLNHKVMFSGELKAEQQPSVLLRNWNLVAIVVTALFSLGFVGLNIFSPG